ncbi:Membrane protein [Kitasatospora sp. MMS16-BH015]|uniref:SPW repeat protein n=1 Tax=Kitasatospora sp. MMS16-BH015 TaxID=2018025 RepID=UPI000CA12D78|nr:SPW repeat protein [Kitasatospora sp. MMS16-BH015]AUG80791.1 Membrane protein [Kitasatospora sp. MMS16-BH015]
MSTQLPMSMEHHPDIVALREQYERASVTPRAQAVEALAVVAGLFLAVSPWVVGYSAAFSALSVCNLILGLAFAGLMGGYGTAFERTHARAWACALIGAWTVIAPWAINGGAHVRRTILTNCITGGLMLCLALAAAGMATSMITTRRARSGG